MKTSRKWTIGIGLLLVLAAGTAPAADFSSWQKKLPITFTGYNPPGGATTLTNFPALVVLSTNISGFSYSDFLSLTNQDLRFTAADETTELNYEIESWNTNGSSYVWLQATNLVDTNTSVWAYWGKSGTNAPAYTTNGAVWLDYKAVWHLPDGTLLTSYDSTSNRNTCAIVGPSATNGVVGGAAYFKGNYLKTTSPIKLASVQKLSVSLWLNQTVFTNNNGLALELSTNVNEFNQGSFYINPNPSDVSSFRAMLVNTGPAYNDATFTRPSPATWHHYMFVFDRTLASSQVQAVYVDGVAQTLTHTFTSLGGNTYFRDDTLYFMSRGGTSLLNTGSLDEVQFRPSLVSSNWAWATYMNQASNGMFAGSFNSYGEVQAGDPDLPQIANVGSPGRTDTSADIAGTLVTNGASAATVYLYWSTSDGTTNASDWTTGGSVTNLGAYADGVTFTNTLPGLASNATYYWNHSAANASGTVWGATAGSPSFKTLGPPAVNNGIGATGITPSGATLNGTLTNGTTAHVFVLLGTQDGVWTVTNDLGTLSESAFSNTVSGLTPGMTNYYTCYATNAYGSALATPSAMFTTPGSPYYVATNGASPWDGSSWATAFTNIQEAVNAATNGGTIYLAAHTFRCPGQVNWSNSSYVSIQGGYAGDGSPGSLAATPTILTRTGGVMRIMAISGVTNGALTRVTITGGFSSGMGGGLFVTNAAGLTLTSCTISNNRAYRNGGGAWIGSSTNITFASCLITANTQQDSGSDWVARYGGGLYATISYGLVSNCIVSANSALPIGHNSMLGGGLALANGRWEVAGSTFAYNIAVYNADDGAPWSPYTQGGAIYIDGGTHMIRNSLIIANDIQSTYPTLAYGDGISLQNGALTILNSTLYGNVGEGVRRQGGTLAITNSILWNHPGTDVAGAATLGFVDTQSGLSNGVQGCFSANPLFENGFYLAAASPCVNTGSTTAAAAGLDTLTTRSDGTLDADTVDLGYHYPAGVTIIPDLYVAETGTNTNDGLSRETALRSITAALSAATVGTRIHVGAGNYTNGLETFPLSMTKHNLQLLGTNNATTIVNATNSNQRVLNVTGMAGGRIEGLTLKGGKSTGSGGALNVSLAGDLVVASCVIASNRSSLAGGGIYLQGSPQALITNCLFQANQARSAGDWITVTGGGLHALDSGGVVAQSDFIGNACAYYGHDAAYGGGVALYGGGWLLDRCVVVSNRASAYPAFGNGWMTSRGAGLYVGSGTHRVRNSLLASNDCITGYNGMLGDGIGVANGIVVIESSTLADNGGEGVRWFAGTVSATNCILWNNGDDVVGTVTPAYSDIEDGDSVGVNGCISADPLFKSIASGDYRLQGGSPCINTGTNLDWMVGSVDLDGNARRRGSRVDIGAYEIQAPPGTVFTVR